MSGRFQESARRPKIGQLLLAGGRCNGRQVVSKAWIDASTTSKLAAARQSIRFVPELDLVVVGTAGYYQDYSPHAFQVQRGVFDDVLRATPPAG